MLRIKKGSIIRSVDELHENMQVKIHLTDGNTACNITSKEKEPANENGADKDISSLNFEEAIVSLKI